MRDLHHQPWVDAGSMRLNGSSSAEEPDNSTSPTPSGCSDDSSHQGMRQLPCSGDSGGLLDRELLGNRSCRILFMCGF